MKKYFSLLIYAVLLWLAFSALNLAFSWLLGNYKVDMTVAKKYTLSAQTIEIIENLPQPVLFKFYVSENLGDYDLEKAEYANYVASFIIKYQQQNPGKIRLEIRKVSPYSDMEKNAVNDGMIAFNQDGENLYLGLNISGRAIPHLEILRRNYLENDINRILFNLSGHKLPIVGVTAPNLPLFSGNRRDKNWSIVPLLQHNYDVVEVPENRSYIPLDMDMVIVVNPVQLSELFLYALDQHLMRGGKVIMLLDPYSEILRYYLGYPPVSRINFRNWLAHHGVDYNDAQVVGDMSSAEKINIEEDGIIVSKPYPLWFTAFGSGLSNLRFRSPGHLTGNIVSLIETTEQGGQIRTDQVRYMPFDRIISLFEQTNRSYILAALRTGDFISYYNQGILDNTVHAQNIPSYMPFSIASPKLAIIADSDFIADDTWVYSSDRNNPVYGTVPSAANMNFLLNLIDDMVGGRELLRHGDIMQLVEKANIAKNIYDGAYEKYAGRISELEGQEIKSAAEIRQLRHAVGIRDHEEMEHRRQLAAAEEQNQEQKAEIRRLGYLANVEADFILNSFILANLVVFPILGALLIFAVIFVLRRRNLAKLKRVL